MVETVANLSIARANILDSNGRVTPNLAHSIVRIDSLIDEFTRRMCEEQSKEQE